MDPQPTAEAETDEPLARPGESPRTDAPRPLAPPDAPGLLAAPTDAPRLLAPPDAPGPLAPPDVPRPLVRRLLAPVATLAGVAAAFAYVGAVDPNEPGHYPVCPMLRLAGVFCPGCGGLRSAHAFVHGDLPAALGANALAVVGYGVFAAVMALWLVRVIRGVPMRLTISPVSWWGIGAVLALFTLVRNLPFGSALAP
ncbi:hypothetical protein AQF52_2071 [Streptomyces venezuelae]|uniref:DUF2752 domain-containing protein n=1 Tax=Streptomyces gardneri TaxID=66892 RepID=UPI0006BDEFF4|nr:DUF2752 domain-containing protein [Streptomyces gardneri]ALO07666.1 hypothetical protein AQF52_2071 [Streptomyces venezuelae]WRK36289.1 DUF2752 domain-containing protein [Streptomyces venezuelae]CUM42002.1 putative membrane protein [Streptomyces venezuelae]